MPAPEKSDFFLSRRGSVATVAREVEAVLAERGYTVFVQDYDIPLTANFVEAMHEAIKNSRDLVVLFTGDYESSPHTRKEFTSFKADMAHGAEERRIVVLRIEDVPARGLFARHVFQDLVGIDDPDERRRRILAAAEGQSQAAKPPPRPFAGAPPRIASFTGRAGELDRLDQILIGGDKPAAITQIGIGRAAVQGMGGVGKTSLAVEYAYRYRDLYAGVWWCPAESRSGLLTALAALAVQLGAAAADEPDLEKAARAALRRLAEQRATWLLVYDNVTSPDEIAELLPAGGARVLITSRFPDWSGWAEEVALDVLPPDEAAAFLESRAGRQDAAGAAALAAALGHLPLALDHAAAYCRRAQMRFADYAVKAASLIAAAPRGAAYPRSVAATFDLAIAAAAALCPAAEAVMAYLAQCAPERIPMLLVDGAVDDEAERAAALIALNEVSLVKPDPFEDGTSALTVHRLVQAAARSRAAANDVAAAAAARLNARLATIYPKDGYDNPASWPLCAQLTPHLLGTGDAAADAATQADLLNRAANYFHGRADYARAAPLLQEALAIRETALGPDHPSTATSLDSLAGLLQDRGDLAAARPLFERALAIREKALGHHPLTAAGLNNLALLLRNQGDSAAARPLFERALAIGERALGPEHPSIATGLNNLALVLQDQGDFVAARTLHERALGIREKSLGPDHPDTAISLNNLAMLLQAQGDLAPTRSLFERALAISEKALGPDHPSTATSLNNLARLLQAQGDLTAARPLYERALAIYEKALGPDHPSTAASLGNLAHLLFNQGEFAVARPLFERALAVAETALGAGHPDTAISLNNLAALLRAQGDLTAARLLFERALAIYENTLGHDQYYTARARANLARLVLRGEQPVEAMALGEAALRAHDTALGPDHPWTRDSARVTAEALAALGRAEEAAGLRARYGLDLPPSA